MLDPEDMDLLVKLDPYYADTIFIAVYEQEKSADRVSEELPSPITYDELIEKKLNDGHFFRQFRPGNHAAEIFLLSSEEVM